MRSLRGRGGLSELGGENAGEAPVLRVDLFSDDMAVFFPSPGGRVGDTFAGEVYTSRRAVKWNPFLIHENFRNSVDFRMAFACGLRV
jgi:hypothetical protein